MKLSIGEYTIKGYSRGGEGTWFKITPPKILLDAGKVDVSMVGVDKLVISHTHLDHVLALPLVISWNFLRLSKVVSIFCRDTAVKPLLEYLNASSVLDGRSFKYELCPLREGEVFTIGDNWGIKIYKHSHHYTSIATVLVKKKKHLKKKYSHLSGRDLAHLKSKGVEVEETIFTDEIIYFGDCGYDVFSKKWRSKIVFIDATFLDSEKDRARLYNHLTVEEVVYALNEKIIECETVILHHLSWRYKVDQVIQSLKRYISSPTYDIYLWADRPYCLSEFF